MRCRYLADGQCKNKATVWYHSIGICDEHKELLTKIIESKGSTAEFVVIPPKRKSIAQLVNMFEDTDPLHVVADIEKRQAIMCILEKHNPRMFYEWVASKYDSPRGYFLHGKAATAKRRRTQLAPDAGDSAVSTSSLQASALSTSQAEPTPTPRR